jgi:hypothetical protein
MVLEHFLILLVAHHRQSAGRLGEKLTRSLTVVAATGHKSGFPPFADRAPGKGN